MPVSLWSFALRAYAQPEIARQCLDWQQRFDADVNLLLAAFWLSEQGRAWDGAQVRALIAHCGDWRAHAVLPLRASRRALAVSAIYDALKQAELAAERVQIGMVQAWLEHHPAVASSDAIRCNLQTYADCLRYQPNPAELRGLALAAGATRYA